MKKVATFRCLRDCVGRKPTFVERRQSILCYRVDLVTLRTNCSPLTCAVGTLSAQLSLSVSFGRKALSCMSRHWFSDVFIHHLRSRYLCPSFSSLLISQSRYA